MGSIERRALQALLDAKLAAPSIPDYCPNGLQVEGKSQICKVVTGVTASQALIDAAIAAQADAILVHHGYFWKGEAPAVVGMKKKRLQALLQHDISLFAYHLPLDVHPELGNNARLAQLLGLQQVQPLPGPAPEGVVMTGRLAQAEPIDQFSARVETLLGRSILTHAAGERLVQQLAWCTGGGQGYIDAAAAAGLDLFLTGEVSEQTIHSSREQGIHFIAAGHHATERYGIEALGQWLAAETGLDVEFIDIPNPA
ncbi:Nif3-like dinuclear metal center hexameric protein [Alkalimonas delamerensis]|uniref:Nif3-like dinuclear metal center hexameric protein n=1 Tax=Alkalimonas delamerensis TaxID=265981 RepID=A0ABT9GNB8_9GAMM|nr:Nif3-like dinuclear metal center hexameric protein [Alkalimonas delamerensis]MDP4528414.1 Nif3-like dinuclear metal center hexameric protein [Alkalimonas delamerensis]